MGITFLHIVVAFKNMSADYPNNSLLLIPQDNIKLIDREIEKLVQKIDAYFNDVRSSLQSQLLPILFDNLSIFNRTSSLSRLL